MSLPIQEVRHEGVRVSIEILKYSEVIRAFKRFLYNASLGQMEKSCFRIGHQERRVSGDDELCIPGPLRGVNNAEELDLVCG